MTHVRHALLLLLAFVLQTTWVHLLAIADLRPDLILVVLVQIALRTQQTEATLLGFGVGLLQDLYMPADLGLRALAGSLVGFAVSQGRTGVVADSFRVQLAFLCGAALVHDLICYLGSSGISLLSAPTYWLAQGFGQGLYTIVLGAAVAMALQVRRSFLNPSQPEP